MARAEELLALIDNAKAVAADAGADDDPLLCMLVQLAFSDEVLQEDELALLERVRPGRSATELMEWALGIYGTPIDVEALRNVLPTEVERWDCLRLAARMIFMDGELDDSEIADLAVLAEGLELPASAAEVVVGEILAIAGAPDIQRLKRSIASMFWESLTPRRESLAGPLNEVVPGGSQLICTMSAGSDELLGVYDEGFAAVFESGPRFVPWADVRRYTRVPVPGAAIHLGLSSGERLSVVDSRMKDMRPLLDRIYGVGADAPGIERPGGL